MDRDQNDGASDQREQFKLRPPGTAQLAHEQAGSGERLCRIRRLRPAPPCAAPACARHEYRRANRGCAPSPRRATARQRDRPVRAPQRRPAWLPAPSGDPHKETVRTRTSRPAPDKAARSGAEPPARHFAAGFQSPADPQRRCRRATDHADRAMRHSSKDGSRNTKNRIGNRYRQTKADSEHERQRQRSAAPLVAHSDQHSPRQSAMPITENRPELVLAPSGNRPENARSALQAAVRTHAARIAIPGPLMRRRKSINAISATNAVLQVRVDQLAEIHPSTFG